MYDQHILPVTGPAVIAALPNTGSEIVVQIAIAAAVGMIVWGLSYSLTAKAGAKV